jgi:hypothetical protein
MRSGWGRIEVEEMKVASLRRLRMEESMMHRLAGHAEAYLAPQEVGFVKAILEGSRLEDAMAKFGLTRSEAASVFSRAIACILPYANGPTDTDSAGAIHTTAKTESDLETILLAVDRLPGRALAELASRYVRRLLPFAAVFADTLPMGAEQFRAVESALQSIERFAGGETIPSDLAALAHVVEQLRDATPGLGKGPEGERAYICLFNACATLSFVLAGNYEDRFDLSTGFKMGVHELSSLTDLATTIAADAKRLLNSGIDLAEGIRKLGDAHRVHPLGPLWPQGEPDWYRQEVARMSKTTGVVRISPLAFLRSIAVLFWSAFRHPFRTTEVDLVTGRVVRQY